MLNSVLLEGKTAGKVIPSVDVPGALWFELDVPGMDKGLVPCRFDPNKTACPGTMLEYAMSIPAGTEVRLMGSLSYLYEDEDEIGIAVEYIERKSDKVK